MVGSLVRNVCIHFALLCRDLSLAKGSVYMKFPGSEAMGCEQCQNWVV